MWDPMGLVGDLKLRFIDMRGMKGAYAGIFSTTAGSTDWTFFPDFADTSTACLGSSSKLVFICSNARSGSAEGRSILLITGMSLRPWANAR